MEQLKSLAEEMAAEHQTVVSGRKVRPKLPKLEENKQALIQAYQSTNEK